MAELGVVATKDFVGTDQSLFASLSGDYNPMHLDPVAARRTHAGAAVVHGIHALLWALDAFVHARPNAPIRSLKAKFERFIYPGDRVVLSIVGETDSVTKMELRVGELRVTALSLGLGARREQPVEPEPQADLVVHPEVVSPQELQMPEMEGLSGFLLPVLPLEASSAAFPSLAGSTGKMRVASLAAVSRLVGMVCPGLHSILAGISVEFVEASERDAGLRFTTTLVDERFRRVVMKVSAPGMSGSVDCFARHPPVEQPSMTDLRGLVGPQEFRGSTALIVGGSRGLGELTAKLIATGGGRTILTYAVGLADARGVAAEIEAAGGDCSVVSFDARLAVEPQLLKLAADPTHLYYFATSRIFKQKSTLFSPQILAEFLKIYVDGFYETCRVIASCRQRGMVAFYPSSIAVEERPRDVTEYAMAKAAGEVLCADMNRSMPRVRIEVRRLPRLLTDQTTTLVPLTTVSPLDVMLPTVRAVQAIPLDSDV